MKFFVIFISSLVVTNALTYIPSPQRLSRDVSELQNQYLATSTSDLELPVESVTEDYQNSAVLAEDGYKYKTVSKLRFRKQRDVSHLNLAYLPPAPPQTKEHKQVSSEYSTPVDIKELKLSSNEYLPPPAEIKKTGVVTEAPPPSNKYLPPVEEMKVAKVSTEPQQHLDEYLPPVAEIKEAKVVTKPQRTFNEYLPPVTEVIQAATENSQIPSNEYLPPVKMGEDISEVPFGIEIRAPEQPAIIETSAKIVDAPAEVPQDTAVLEADGYHYKVPASTLDLFPIVNPTTEYLPPPENFVMETEGHAVLEGNGNHYRFTKRRF